MTVILEPAESTTTSITLVETGSATIHAVFAETPRVIAQGQGPAGQVAASGGLVAWIVGGHGPTATINAVDDAPGALPRTLAGAQTNPGEIVIDPVTLAVYWTNGRSGARDGSGVLINDGSIWKSTGSSAVELASGRNPSDL